MKTLLYSIPCALAFLACGATSFAAKATENPSAQIDRILEKSWKEAGVKGNSLASDEVFVRRIYLDAVGRIPTLVEAQTFLDSKDKNKRSKLIEQLLASEGYVNHYFNFWADILRINVQQGGGRNISPFYISFVRDSLAENKPYDQFVRELITAEGMATENGAIGYTYRDRGMPLDHMANTVRIFLGTRLECAQCHNHPFDKWTQMDFFEMAAFSYGMNAANGGSYAGYQELRAKLRKMSDGDRVKQRNLDRALQEISRPLRNNGTVTYDEKHQPQLPHDYAYPDAKPKDKIAAATMFGDAPEIATDSARVEVYADWMTSPENPRFTKVIANRLWKEAFGIGLIEPVDELMDSTVPANPELMAYLEKLMIESGFDIKGYLSAIFNSKAYQREASEVEIDLGSKYEFTGPVLRRMTAEQTWDSVVTLINPKPELTNWKADQQNLLRVAQQRQMQDAIGGIPEDKMLKFTQEIAKTQKQLADQTKKLTEKIAALRKAGKDDEARELGREVNRTRQKIQKRVEELVYKPALKETDVETVAYRFPGGQMMEMTPEMVGSNGQGTDKLRKAQTAAEAAMIELEMTEMGLTDETDRRKYLGFRRSAGRYLRAAHQPSPAPAGHFLRQFGQSDRETIENASDEASVPQVLNLMNGNDFPQVAGGNSMLTWNVSHAETAEEKLNVIFLSMLARNPTEDEQQLLMAASETRGEELFTDTIFALLNNQEFLFIQ
ncbi:MAG: hypothetical protein ACI8UO_003185 [Verrucomicrobiales bacterium]|jgi:hypothetical protein